MSPLLPGLAYSINSKVKISQGAKNLYSFDWLFGFVTSIFIYTTLSLVWRPKEQLVPHTVYGILPDEEGVDAYNTQYDEKVLRKESLVGNPKSFANVDGIDTVGSAIHTRKSVDETARANVEFRRASLAAQGGQHAAIAKEA